MKKNYLINNSNNKLAAYSALAGAFVLTGINAKAQIVYTDLDPNETVGLNDAYDLDLNADSDIDFTLSVGTLTFPEYFYVIDTISGDSIFYDGLFNQILIYPGTGNGVYGNTAYGFAYPYAMNDGNLISEDLSFVENSFQTMALYLSVVDYPAAGEVYFFGEFGNWVGENGKFLGLRFDIDGENHYGWVRLDVDNLEITIDDYAYNATPDAEIEAGATEVAVYNTIKNDQLTAYSYGNTINIVVKELAAQSATVKIYNILGEVVYTNALNFSGMQITLNNESAGMYTLHIEADGAIYNKQMFINQ